VEEDLESYHPSLIKANVVAQTGTTSSLSAQREKAFNEGPEPLGKDPSPPSHKRSSAGNWRRKIEGPNDSTLQGKQQSVVSTKLTIFS
jgi:hypothetical protein